MVIVADAPIINGVKLGLTPNKLGKALKIKITPGAPNTVEVSTFRRDKKIFLSGSFEIRVYT